MDIFYQRITWLSIFFLSGLLSGCGDSSKMNAKGMQMPPAPVSITKVKPSNIAVQYEYRGQVAGSLEVEIHARISGVIEKRLFKEGHFVQQGELLFQIDAKPYQAQLAQAEAALAGAKASRTQALAQLKKAKRDYKRVAELNSKNLSSRSDRDDAESAIELANAAIAQANAAIMQAKARIKTQQINLDYTQIKAPISGVIGKELKSTGSLVGPGSSSLLATIAQINPVYINFGIPEAEYLQRQTDIQKGDLQFIDHDFQVQLKNTQGQLIAKQGKINFIDYKVEATTGSFAVRADIENAAGNLSPGQFVRVVLSGAIRPNVISLPQKAVLDGPQGKFVYIATPTEKGMIAMPRPIKVGEWVVQENGEMAWVIQQGLNTGDAVIVNGMAKIFFPGMPIMDADKLPAQQPNQTQH